MDICDQGRFWTPEKEPMKEPRKVLDSKTGTENQTGTYKLAPPSYKPMCFEILSFRLLSLSSMHFGLNFVKLQPIMYTVMFVF